MDPFVFKIFKKSLKKLLLKAQQEFLDWPAMAILPIATGAPPPLRARKGGDARHGCDFFLTLPFRERHGMSHVFC
jgi:hypothetical protein